MPCEPVVLCGTCAMKKKCFENAGNAFWTKYELPLTTKTETSSTETTTNDNKKEKESDHIKAIREKREKRERERQARDGGLVKLSELLKGKCLYKLLECEASASQDDIRNAYRKIILKSHPDKIPNATEEQKKNFLAIQEAFEIIGDQDKRRRYESTLEFDDAIPKKDTEPDKFFEVFAECFARTRGGLSLATCRLQMRS